MNILTTLSFDGTCYSGFQVQKNAPTVCETFQDALEAVLGQRVPVIGCSRTDSGVHAKAFCLNFHAEPRFLLERMPLALNAHLPQDIRVMSARQVPDGFHARYSAAGKEYRYHIRRGWVDSPFTQPYCWRVSAALDLDAMEQAAQLLVGRHDFSAFMSAGSSVQDTVRTVFEVRLEEQGEYLTLIIRADGYLYNMVRIIVGTLVQVGVGDLSAGSVQQALDTGCRSLAGPTAPAKGLFLAQVFYPPQALGDTGPGPADCGDQADGL